MPFKTITIKESAYKRLKAAKRKGESFTELIERKFEEKPDIMKYAGAWSDMTDEEYEEIKSRMKKFKEEFNKDAERRRKHVMRRFGSDN